MEPPVLEIQENTLRVSPRAWDVEWEANRLRVRSGLGRIVFDARFATSDDLLDIAVADFRFNGLRVRLSPGRIERIRQPETESGKCRYNSGSMIETPLMLGDGNLFRFNQNGGAVFSAGLSPFWSCVYLGDNEERTDGFSHPTTWGLPPLFAYGPAIREQAQNDPGDPEDVSTFSEDEVVPDAKDH